MKRIAGVIGFFLLSLPGVAHHIIGGEMYYTFVSKSAAGYRYEITLKLYRGCEPPDRQHPLLSRYVTLSIFDNKDYSFVDSISHIFLDGPYNITKERDNPCIINPPDVCFRVGYYRATVTLPLNKEGYTIAYQECCRSDLLLNANTSGSIGASYFTRIPGSEVGIPGDNSPRFENEEAILLCSRGKVDYTFKATDPDGDELRYAFVPGYTGANPRNRQPVPTTTPPFPTFFYYNGFTGYAPLGPEVTVDSLTGKIRGRARLRPGVYDITIRVRSYRKGKLTATHYRDFQFDIHDCNRVALADIPPLYNECKSATFHFTNYSASNKPYLWNFGDGHTSKEAEPTHTFQKPGTYQVWLKVDPGSPCGDSMESTVKVFPGLKTAFKKDGGCIQFPVQFTDGSSTPFGQIVSRHWDFGDPAQLADTSDTQNPSYQYTTEGAYPVTLKVTTDSGCVQEQTQTFRFYDQPPLTISPDTIFCYKDSFHLKASSGMSGHFKWSPDYRMKGRNSADPIVRPLQDTTYKVLFTDDQGCVNSDSVQLRIKKTLKVEAGSDTVICKGDAVTLHAISDENYAFTWVNSRQDTIATTRDAAPPTARNETYKVLATLGSCSAEDEMHVQSIPYPSPVISPGDSGICYGDTLLLTGSGGAFYDWSPVEGLSRTSGETVLAFPHATTRYTLAVTDTLGCPKPAETAITLRVVPPVKAFAGNDTIIAMGQSFRLHARGGDRYKWSPTEGLSNPGIPDPIVNRTRDVVYKLKVMTGPEGCTGYDSVSIKYLKGPALYVPTAFTPNHDGKNDVFRPIPVGITHIHYFRIYNRWGELVFKTGDYMKGWDGAFKGKPAEAGAYVWMVKATDFKNREITRKGTVLLIR